MTIPSKNQVQTCVEQKIQPSSNIDDLDSPYSIFITIDGDIYIDNGEKGQVDMLKLGTPKPVIVMKVKSSCYGLFVDTADNLYCSEYNDHQVIAKPLDSDLNISFLVAGTGSPGNASNMLSKPMGIFVDINFDLYVTDCDNDRVQRFKLGQKNGSTMAGREATESIELDCPSGIILDADGYLFIVDQGHRRIVRSGSNGYQYVVEFPKDILGILHYSSPVSLSFDSYGNIFVTISLTKIGFVNYKTVVKCSLITNSCGKCNNILDHSDFYAHTK